MMTSRISTSLSLELCSDLVAFLRLNSEKRCAYDLERYEAMRAEVDKLSTIGFIKEVDYPTWLANVVMIFMHPEDQAHTSFITNHGLYCYKAMPFRLKNVGATYQRLVNSLFAPLIVNTIEVYVDDMLVKSRTADQHILNLSAIQRGIEANPEKIQGILDMTIPKTVKDIQSLTRHVAALTRFISKATDRCASFFKALKGSKRSITWTAECDKAFSELKEYMSQALLLSTLEPGDILVIYLSVSAKVVSFVLIRPKESAEHPVNYVSKALQDVEVPYPDIEKLAFALVVSARRLRPYFQAHTIHVLTNQPLRQVLQEPDFWEGCGAGLVLISPDKIVLEYALRFKFHASNNEAKYEALLTGLRLAKEMGAKEIQIFSDSQLVVHQVNQDFTANDISITAYLQHTSHLLATFDANLIS
ncbi:unnamed protein product [Prunus armeniaca]